ncbi:helix-turn-helix domain-containing protein [Aeromicrobium wangtongii]|uniref:helix-turn-helix domain-containing protein n=1 Tax=Aeromicrobium wangtongii TaxID=2969247 RepID=UPI0020175893|nr:helix-turn-helix domain-containing protein [Aeromicrobium wangtongii]MCL3818759.1 hypothetical protein [Aeromicrobium wangtongii]
MFALTIDQRRSRQRADAVPGLLADLNRYPLVREFERTAGDEVQGLSDDPAVVVDMVCSVVATQQWWIGIGLGPVDEPIPPSVRASRGPALIAARAAVERSSSSPVGLAVEGKGARHAETALHALARVITDRTEAGAEAVAAMAAGGTQKAVARRLGISPQAFSRRLQVARWSEEQRLRDLAIHLLAPSEFGVRSPETRAEP